MLSRLIAASTLVLMASAAIADQSSHFDEAALRYYASLGQKDRVAAETRRLQGLDPNWHVPADLYTAPVGRADEEPLWALFAQNKLDELAVAIAQRQKVEPTWTPSEDLSSKIKARKLRGEIMNLAKSDDWHEIVRTFKSGDTAWVKTDAEALWVVAEAYARENDCTEAYILYHSIIADHTDPNERKATIEHAIAFIPMAQTEKLIAMGRKDASGTSEFDSIAIDITRARISAFLHDEPANDVTPEELKRFEDFVRDATNPDEPGLVAWYAYKRRDFPLALDWFKLAIGRGGDAMIAHGLAHTLRQLGMKREAEEVAYAWREPLVNNSILFIDLLEEDFTKERPPFIEPARVSRYAQVAAATESGEGAQALAWYAYNTCQYTLALQWFERAVAWLPKEATAYGYALTLQRLHRGKEFRDVVNRYDGLFPKVVGLAFDDGVRRPPPPCENNAREPSAPPKDIAMSNDNALDWTGRTMADTLKPMARSESRPVQPVSFARARVPSPDTVSGNNVSGLAPLKKKTEFPFAVSPENPLRFSITRADAGGQMARELQTPWPLVARRVPGVGAMPYERYGFTLMPGWDGTREASSPTAAERSSPVGTLWALEQSLRDGGKTDASLRAVDTLSRRPLVKAGP